MPPESSELLDLVDQLEQRVPAEDPKVRASIAALREEIIRKGRLDAEQEELFAKYQEAYASLSAPAHRVGTFLRWEKVSDDKELALVALGDTEYVAEVDPLMDAAKLLPGSQVRLSESYAVVGVMPTSGRGGIIKVAELFEDGRIKIGSDTPGSEGRIVGRSQELQDARILVGDEVRIEPSGRLAVEHFGKQESRDYFLESVPELPWEKVGGQQEAIKLIRDTIEQPLLHPELFAKYDKKPVKGILLFGPPGCGKTLIGKAVAYNLTKEYSKQVGHEVKEYFMALSGPKILNMWLGETERMVRELFRTAREKAKEGRLVFIFMDEAESVLRTRSSGRYLNISNTVVPQFCAELDGLVSLENVVLMLTSNRPDYIDPAVLRPERIDRKVKIVRPDKESSQQILAIYLHAGIPLDPEVLKANHGEIDCARKELIEELTEYLWRKSKDAEFLKVSYRNGTTETLYQRDLMSGALLKSIIDRAKDYAIKRSIAQPKKETGITLIDLKEAADAEFKENEIFPKTDTQEDWLQLLDVAPENVAAVRPIGKHRGEEFTNKSVS